MLPYWGVCDWDISDISHIQPPSIWIFIHIYRALSQSLGPVPQKWTQPFVEWSHFGFSESKEPNESKMGSSKVMNLVDLWDETMAFFDQVCSRFWVSQGFPWFPRSIGDFHVDILTGCNRCKNFEWNKWNQSCCLKSGIDHEVFLDS